MSDATRNEPYKILSAHRTGPFHGVAELSRDWTEAAAPPFALEAPAKLRRAVPMGAERWARLSAYYTDAAGHTVFLLRLELHPNLDWQNETVFAAGDFNHWQPDESWALRPQISEGETELALTRPETPQAGTFKFVTRSGKWLEPPAQAPNRCRDFFGNINHRIDPARTGHHAFVFASEAPANLAAPERLLWTEASNEHAANICAGELLLQQETSLEMGAHIRGGETVFRIFAPRATAVRLELSPPPNDVPAVPADLAADHAATLAHAAAVPAALALTPLGDGAWEARLPQELRGWRYSYRIAGDNSVAPAAGFDENTPVLDPWALAALGPAGPGIVVDTARIPAAARQHRPPAPADAVIVEAHLRDLLSAAAPAALAASTAATAPVGFRELAAWLRSPDCYLRRLGANVLELLPVQEYERSTTSTSTATSSAAEYHWGYMPVNWFAPASAYASAPAAASHTADLQNLVAACHEVGISVVLDVVYNHTGSPCALGLIDKAYYLETAPDGTLSNWSGCGNDLRPTTPMARRLVLESLRHLVEHFDVDGFRFDLAELLGAPLLREIERGLRPLKPGLLLIAEPWSFRGNIVRALDTTGYTSWNDGFREFLPAYVRDAGSAGGLRHFLSGSPASPAAMPFHSLNYTESHDDRCWLDRITENPANNGTTPTPADARRTRLMAAILFASLGVPMLAAGQDFLRTKHGANNTYQRGDLNALDYARLDVFRDTHEYFRRWIAFRLGPSGAALRLRERPPEGFLRFFHAENSNALAALYNASDLPAPAPPPLLFAVNPAATPAAIALPDVAKARFRQLADADVFDAHGLPPEKCFPWDGETLTLPALSAGLWAA
ncbi:MAG: hypothetical protein LBT53_01640 [Puniceicoccales bacterium]|jgi:pullulanase/glycogen debranching enzyme|nr:hypothetical protein [Puniceicoccales bacterium]